MTPVATDPSGNIHFELRIVPAGTGSAVWDTPYAEQNIRRFMPPDKQHGPMLGVLHLGALRPTPAVLQNAIVSIGEDVLAGKYGSFTFIVSSEDEPTRDVISDIAKAKGLPIFISSSPTDFEDAQPVGDLTGKEKETLTLVLNGGGTLTAARLGEQLGIEQTTAGNRLVALQRKGYLQRVARPHPEGDLFIDPRSVRTSDTD